MIKHRAGGFWWTVWTEPTFQQEVVLQVNDYKAKRRPTEKTRA